MALCTRVRAQQPAGEAMELLRNRVVVARHAHELRELRLERRMALAHDFDLTLHERDRGAAARMRQSQPRQQRLVAFEEFRIVLQIARDGFFFGFRGGSPRASRVVIVIHTSK